MQATTPRILIVTDQYHYGRLLEQHLSTVWGDVETKVHEPSHSGTFHPAFTAAGFDCVLLDHEVLGGRGFEWLSDLKAPANFPPLLYFSSGADTRVGEQAVQMGAAEWFVRERIHNRRFASVVQQQVSKRRQAVAQFRARPEAERQNKFGPVTIRGHVSISELAAGGSSKVYLRKAGRPANWWCLKFGRRVRSPASIDPASNFERFLQEYELLLRIRHPNVVRIHELGIADDHAYIAMEYFAAGDLRAQMREAMEPERAVDFVAQIARSLAAVHQVGVLHRDLKPGNIMVRNDGSLALIDFGLAKHVVRSVDITAAGTIFGTPYYISPEQGHGDAVDERSDLYSLGIILYEMLMQRRPYTASTPMGLFTASQRPLPLLPTSCCAITVGASLYGQAAFASISKCG